MGRPEEVAAGIKSGQSPRSMALNIGISHASVVQYLYTAVGRELLSRSEILFAIEDRVASVVEAIVAGTGIRTISELTRTLSEVENDLTFTAGYRSFKEDMLLYFRLREAPLADMYESLCRLETFMHARIRTELERGYGSQDWWRKGIPEGVRKDCVLAKEADPEPQADPYCLHHFHSLAGYFRQTVGHLL